MDQHAINTALNTARMSATTLPPNAQALAHIFAVQPRWVGVLSARAALGLPDHVLLHAGPPLADPRHPPPPMRNAALLACVHEGWAGDIAAAERLFDSGAVKLESGLAHRVSMPLVALVGARSTLAVIDAGGDARGGDAQGDSAGDGGTDAGCNSGGNDGGTARWYSFLGTGGGAQLRFGARDGAILERLAFRESTLLPGLRALLAHGPIDLLSIARSALTEGDDLHNRLSSATLLLHAVLASRKSGAGTAVAASMDASADAVNVQAALTTVHEAPLYFLNLWMPACALMLDAAAGTAGSSIVTRMAANGEVCGIQVAGLPGRWFTAPAALVRGPFMKGAPADPQFPPATGDSGIIDAFGLGGQVLRRAPSLQSAFAPWLAPDDDARALALLAGMHPVLGVAAGLDAAAVATSGRAPLLSTGMVSADGRGLLGRGVCEMPLAPFVSALAALQSGAAKG